MNGNVVCLFCIVLVVQVGGHSVDDASSEKSESFQGGPLSRRLCLASVSSSIPVAVPVPVPVPVSMPARILAVAKIPVLLRITSSTASTAIRSVGLLGNAPAFGRELL
jgi:hypothetical protein